MKPKAALENRTRSRCALKRCSAYARTSARSDALAKDSSSCRHTGSPHAPLDPWPKIAVAENILSEDSSARKEKKKKELPCSTRGVLSGTIQTLTELPSSCSDSEHEAANVSTPASLVFKNKVSRISTVSTQVVPSRFKPARSANASSAVTSTTTRAQTKDNPPKA